MAAPAFGFHGSGDRRHLTTAEKVVLGVIGGAVLGVVLYHLFVLCIRCMRRRRSQQQKPAGGVVDVELAPPRSGGGGGGGTTSPSGSARTEDSTGSVIVHTGSESAGLNVDFTSFLDLNFSGSETSSTGTVSSGECQLPGGLDVVQPR